MPWCERVASHLMVTCSGRNEEHCPYCPRSRCPNGRPGMDALDNCQYLADSHIDRSRRLGRCRSNARGRRRNVDRFRKLRIRRAMPTSGRGASICRNYLRALRRKHRRQTGGQSRACRLSNAWQYHRAGEIYCEISAHITLSDNREGKPNDTATALALFEASVD